MNLEISKIYWMLKKPQPKEKILTKGMKIIINLTRGKSTTYKPAMAKIAPEAPTMNTSGEPKILAPKSVRPKNPVRRTERIPANKPAMM